MSLVHAKRCCGRAATTNTTKTVYVYPKKYSKKGTRDGTSRSAGAITDYFRTVKTL